MISWLPLTARNNHTDVFLSLNGTVIPDHGYVDISDIGSNDNTALLCITNRPPPSGSTTPARDWFAPDETRVGGDTPVPGFVRNRGPMVVRLKRTTGTAAEGIYKCIIDSANENKELYVGLYKDGRGITILFKEGIFQLCK